MGNKFAVFFTIFLFTISFGVFAGGESEAQESMEDPSSIESEDEIFDPELISQAGFQPLSEPQHSVQFTVPLLNEEMASMQDFEGKLTVLNFWATWCPPCREEMPSMQSLYETMGDDNFAIFAIDLQESEQTVEDFIDQNGYTFTFAIDTTGNVARQYGVRSIPTSFLISPEGYVIGAWVGGREWDTPAMIEAFQELAQ
ncbi:MAG: TlpA family protein disulfide reductase [Spirochaetia bacterium]